MDWIFPKVSTNEFNVPMNDDDCAMAKNQLASLFSGTVFNWTARTFPKHSWPWTVARESALVMLNQGRYTDQELQRLYEAESTGPIGCLTLSYLLAWSHSPAAKTFAMRGLMRLSAEDFLQDCDLVLHGDSGAAQAFAKFLGVLRTLPPDELSALCETLPEAEGKLLRETADVLSANPGKPPGEVLVQPLTSYWNESLRAKVRASLYRLTATSKGAEEHHAAVSEGTYSLSLAD